MLQMWAARTSGKRMQSDTGPFKEGVKLQQTIIEGQMVGRSTTRPNRKQSETELIGSASEVTVFIEGKKVAALLDTGSTVSTTYNLTDFSASEVLDNHKSVLTSFGIQSNSEELDLPYIYWIPKMHKNPYKHRFIAGSSKCSTKPLSILLTKLLTHIKQGLQKYCETAYSRSGVNQMWILKNSKELLDHLKSPNFNLITNIKSFDFSTLYTTIPHQKLKSRLATIIRNSFLHKNGNRRYKYLVLGR